MSWEELPGQLRRFSAMLRREHDTRRTSDFIDAQAGRFLADWKAKRRLTAQWIPLPLPRDQGLHPVGCQIQDCYLSFQFEANTDTDALLRSDFQLQVHGLLDVGSALVELQDHWRIDSEKALIAGSVTNPTEMIEGREPHPVFHFQRGSYAQDAFAAMTGFVPGSHTDLGKGSWKGLMQYPGPRIASLPFDPVLAIDFCIAQNNGPLWKRLRNVPEYFTIIEESQGRLWRPFLEALSARPARRQWLGSLIVV